MAATSDRSSNFRETVHKNASADLATDSAQRGHVEAARVEFGMENRTQASPGGRSAVTHALQESANVDRSMTVAPSAYREDQNGKVATNNAEPPLPTSHSAVAHSSRVLDATGQLHNNEPQVRLSWSPVVHQVADGILTQIRHNKNEAVLTLDPPELGHIKIELVLDKDQLRAHILAETADSRRLLQHHLPELRQALHLQHLDLVDVRVDSGSWNAMSHEFTEGFQRNFTGERESSPSFGSGNSSVSAVGSLDDQRDRNEQMKNGRVSMWV
jgi:flagellar hook-length control protein FliK